MRPQTADDFTRARTLQAWRDAARADMQAHARHTGHTRRYLATRALARVVTLATLATLTAGGLYAFTLALAILATAAG